MQYVSSWSRKYANGETVSLVFAEQRQYKDHAAKIHEMYQASNLYHGLGSLTIAKPKLLIPLQAADLVCYETYKHMELHQEPGYVLRPALVKLLPKLSEQSGFFDCDNLPNLTASDWLLPDLDRN